MLAWQSLQTFECAHPSVGSADEQCVSIKKRKRELNVSRVRWTSLSFEINDEPITADVPLANVDDNRWLVRVRDSPITRGKRVISTIGDVTSVIAALPLP
jgi:hypothetical protein